MKAETNRPKLAQIRTSNPSGLQRGVAVLLLIWIGNQVALRIGDAPLVDASAAFRAELDNFGYSSESAAFVGGKSHAWIGLSAEAYFQTAESPGQEVVVKGKRTFPWQSWQVRSVELRD